MKYALILGGVLALPLLSQPANAQCAPNNPSANGTVTCTGSDTNGFSDGDAGLTITVQPGASVSNTTGDAIRARGLGTTVTNSGTVSGLTSSSGAINDGIDGRHNLTVTNNATGIIEGSNKAIDAENGDNLTVTNFGTIRADDKAIRNADGDNAVLINSGTIESQLDEGFESGNNAKVTNTGTITASDDAVQVGQNAVIDNYGTIRSVQRGPADTVDPQDAIDIDSGIITNYAGGLIESEDDAAIDYDESSIESEIHNYGAIRGTTGVLVEKDPAAGDNTAAQLITIYSGSLIEGTGGLALDIGAGDDALFVNAGASLIGGGDFGAGNDTLQFLEDMTGLFADGAVMDGGAGDDEVIFDTYLLGDVFSATTFNDILTLVLDNGAGLFEVALKSWESYDFSGTRYTLQDVLNAPAPVPLPAGMALLLPALGALGLFARRRRVV